MKKEYARLFDRVKATFIDAIVLIAMMYAATEIFSLFDIIPNYVRIIVSVFIFILYDPLFTTFYGGTIGHSYSGIGVRRDDDSDKNISLPSAIVRFIIKLLLGWISLLTVTGNEKRKAIHDFIVKSVVLEIKNK
ncbi:MAG: RDD family protein [Flavobacteriaceae bacterium]